MTVKTVRLGAACVCLTLSLSGCPNPNTYTTPRTLDPGKVQWQIAPEVIGVSYNTPTTGVDANGNPVTTTTNVTGVLPMIPSFGVRVGLVDGLDLGVRLQNFDSLAADLKIRLLKGRFDVALDPGLQGFYESLSGTGVGVVYFHAPVLLAYNFSEKVSLVLSPGFVYALVTATVTDASGVTGSASAEGAYGRLGLGFDFRVSPAFAIHPEVTFMREFGNENALIWIGGIGFNIGAQPDYSDLREGPPPPPAAPPSTPQPPADQHAL
jgi:hypothetical protein